MSVTAKKSTLQKKSTAQNDEASSTSSVLTNAGSIVGMVVASAALIGFCFHLIGHQAQSAYLQTLGLGPDLFSQASEWKVISGYLELRPRAT